MHRRLRVPYSLARAKVPVIYRCPSLHIRVSIYSHWTWLSSKTSFIIKAIRSWPSTRPRLGLFRIPTEWKKKEMALSVRRKVAWCDLFSSIGAASTVNYWLSTHTELNSFESLSSRLLRVALSFFFALILTRFLCEKRYFVCEEKIWLIESLSVVMINNLYHQSWTLNTVSGFWN